MLLRGDRTATFKVRRFSRVGDTVVVRGLAFGSSGRPGPSG